MIVLLALCATICIIAYFVLRDSRDKRDAMTAAERRDDDEVNEQMRNW
jgi:hypothetical protein